MKRKAVQGILFFTALALLSVAVAAWTPRPSGKGPIRNAFTYPRKWQEAFNRGRRTPDNRPAADYLQRALRQSRALPAVRSGGIQSLLRPFSIPPSGPSCDWTELGPSPLDDSSDNLTAYVYGNVSGRVTSLALDLANDPTANTLYVGTAYGGVWKSTNALSGSPTFTPISDPAQSLAVGAVGLDTSVNPPILYVGTGELNMDGDSYYGVGILKTANGGVTWGLASTADSGAISFQGLAFSKILVDPSNPATVLAAAGFACCHPGLTNLNQGIYWSPDHGGTWTQVTSSGLNGHSCTDLIYDGSATFYAAVRFQGIYASTDGVNWSLLTSPFPSGTAPSTTNFARASLASRGTTLWCLAADSSDNPAKPGTGDTGLSESDNGGQSWHAVNLPKAPGQNNFFDAGAGGQGTYDQYVAAPAGSTALIAAGIDVWKAASAAGTGTSWTNVTNAYLSNGFTAFSHPDQHAIALDGPGTWFIGNDGGVWGTVNGGASLSNLNTDLGTLQFYSVSPDPSAAGGFLGGTQDNGTSTNHGRSGLTWTQVDGGDGGYTDSNASMAGQFFTENFNIGLFRTDNYGADFFNNTVIDSTYTPISKDSSSILVPYQVIPGSPATVVMGTSRLWKGPGNSNGGSGWVTISPPLLGASVSDPNQTIQALALAPGNSNYIYAATANLDPATPVYQVFTNGGGTTWTDVTSNLPTSNPILALSVDPGNPSVAYVGIQGFTGTNSGHLFQTVNGGTTWVDVTGNLPDAPVNGVLADPDFPTDVYVATDAGVFVTQSVNGASTSWSRMGTALPDSTVLQIKMAETCPRALVAATHGRGAWSICPLDVACPPSPTPTATPTVTATPTITATPEPSFSAQAQPNTTDGRTPVHFVVNLTAADKITLDIYDIADESVYATSVQGNGGLNTITWTPQTQSGQPLASGVYLYYIMGGDGSGGRIKVGKLLVLH